MCTAVLLSACGATSKEGRAGDTLTCRELRVTVRKVARHVLRRRGPELAGLATAGAGRRLLRVNVVVCKEPGQAVGGFSFALKLGSGDPLRPKFPKACTPTTFEVVRERCERGWLVFAIPVRERATAVTFATTTPVAPGLALRARSMLAFAG